MKPVARPALVRRELVDMSTTEAPGSKPASGLMVTAVYHLSEAGWRRRFDTPSSESP